MEARKEGREGRKKKKRDIRSNNVKWGGVSNEGRKEVR